MSATTTLPSTIAPSGETVPPQPERVKIALCQLEVGADKAANIAAAKKAVREAAQEKGAQLIVLPEMWNCPYSNDSFGPYSEPVPPVGTSAEAICEETCPSVAMMAREAKALGVVLVGGSVPERWVEEGDGEKQQQTRLYNTCCVFERDGTLVARHRKTHLFDIDIPGKMTFRESDTLTRGEGATLVDTSAGRLGVGICYDLRFPELALLYARRGASLLVYPGAFNTVTGPLHWELLARARAVDAQCFVAVCSPSRVEGAGYQAWGHSTVVGPFAEVLAKAKGEEQETVVVEMEYGQVGERRRNLPLWAQRRGDLYELVDKREG
jgi:omega-amidase